MKPATLMMLPMLLIGCGGDNGAPVICNANMPSCKVSPTPAPAPPTTQPIVDVTKATCADMVTLNDALYYLRRGASQLDSDGDGKPCEEIFKQ